MRNASTIANTLLVILVTLLISPTNCIAFQEAGTINKQWHQWRGPTANGVAPYAKPPIKWSESTNIAWKVPVKGEGISTPIVWGNKVFLLTATATGRAPEERTVKDNRAMTSPPNEYFKYGIVCLDLQSGKEIWSDVCIEQAPHEGRHKTSEYAAASPMTDGQQLIVSFGSTGIFSYTLDGKKQWSIDLGDMHTRRGWGEATSPVLVDGLVIMNWDNEDQSFIYALDAKTGKKKWEVQRDEPTTWATPLIIERGGQKQIVTNGTNTIVGYELKTGRKIWDATGTTLNAIPCPVEFGDSVICMAGYRGNRAVSLKVDDDGSVKKNWEIERGTPYVPSPLLSENRLYFTHSNKAIIQCVNAQSGETFFGPQRLSGMRGLYGSPIAADRRVYLTSRDGVTVVIKDAESFEVLATNKLDDEVDASPVAIGSKLLIRGRNNLYCIEKQK